MPISTPKLLGRVDPLLQAMLEKARVNPGKIVVIATDIPVDEAKNMMHRLRAMRAGLRLYQQPGSQLHQMGDSRILSFNSEYDPKRKDVRTVVMKYAGQIRPPSDMNREELLRALGYSPSSRE